MASKGVEVLRLAQRTFSFEVNTFELRAMLGALNEWLDTNQARLNRREAFAVAAQRGAIALAFASASQASSPETAERGLWSPNRAHPQPDEEVPCNLPLSDAGDYLKPS